METKYINHIGVSETVQFRKKVPHDYHCNCNLCNPDHFMGEIFHVDSGKYYSNRIRKDYYTDKPREHLDVGHAIGYRWAVQNLCPEGGWVFDPTVGSGTAIVEAINNKRNAVGIELEYPEIAKRSIDAQNSNMRAILINGDARNTYDLLSKAGFKRNSIDLIINGTPYPLKGALSSDAPQRNKMGKLTPEDQILTFNYRHEKNIGLTSGEKWRDLIRDMYNQSLLFLKPGGRFVIIVKDLVRDRKPYNIHKEIIDMVLIENLDMEYEGFFLHKHIPSTMFINTFEKRFPGTKVPLYQTGIVLRKIKI